VSTEPSAAAVASYANTLDAAEARFAAASAELATTDAAALAAALGPFGAEMAVELAELAARAATALADAAESTHHSARAIRDHFGDGPPIG